MSINRNDNKSIYPIMSEQMSVADIIERYGSMNRSELYKICSGFKLGGVNTKSRKSLYLLAIAKHSGVAATESDFNETVPKAKPAKSTAPTSLTKSSAVIMRNNTKISAIIHFSDIRFSDDDRENITLQQKFIENIFAQNLIWRETAVVITGICDTEIAERFTHLLYSCCGAGMFIYNNGGISKFADTLHFITEPIEFANVILHPPKIDAPKNPEKYNIKVSFAPSQPGDFDAIIDASSLESPTQLDFAESPRRYYSLYKITPNEIAATDIELPNPFAKIRIQSPKSPDDLNDILSAIKYEFPHLEISADFDVTETDVRKIVPNTQTVKIVSESPKLYWNIESVTLGNEKYIIPGGISKLSVPELADVIHYMLLSDNRRIKRSGVKFEKTNYGGELRSSADDSLYITTEFDGKKWIKSVRENNSKYTNYDVSADYKHFSLMYIPSKNVAATKKLTTYFEATTISKVQTVCNNICAPENLAVTLLPNKISVQKNGVNIKLAALTPTDNFIVHLGIVAGILAAVRNRMLPRTVVIDQPIDSAREFAVIQKTCGYFDRIILTANSSAGPPPIIPSLVVRGAESTVSVVV